MQTLTGNLSAAGALTKDMSPIFVTNDSYCAPTWYEIAEVQDGDNANKTLSKDDIAKVLTFDKLTGIINVTDTTNPVRWHIFLRAWGKDNMTSATTLTQNVYLNLYNPPPAVVIPPVF